MNEEQVKQHLPEITTLTTELRSDAMSTWTEDKRKDFVKQFTKRARVSRYIALKTADSVRTKAIQKQFISSKHDKAFQDLQTKIGEICDKNADRFSYSYTVGGRPLTELDQIAADQADQILSNLPPLKTAVEIINPEISKAIEQRDAFLDKGKLLFEQADELSGQLDMADVDQKMTVADFRTFVKDRNKKRRDLLTQLDDVSRDGQALETKINKFLYAGLPGLSQAVVDIITNLIEKSTALGTMNRRVEEKVLFGDSAAAVTLLQSFEKDELKVSDEVKAQFDKALEQLKLSGLKKSTRSLKKGK
jgi:hypothetical protein